MQDTNRRTAAGKRGNDNSAGSGGVGAPDDGVDYSPDAVLNRIRNMATENENPTIRIPGWLGLAVVVCIGYIGWNWFHNIGTPKVPLCVVNTSSDAQINIRVDGKSIGYVSRMVGEDPEAALVTMLKPGTHQLEARDRSSKAVIASETVVVEENSHGFLWTPLPDPEYVFAIQTSQYSNPGSQSENNGNPAGFSGVVLLEGNAPLRSFPEYVSHWFKDTPQTVSVPKGWECTYERALRLVPNTR